ncbi:MAG: hypothetical protein RIC19_21025 [Phaeodactylibacter sp.]|uniref:hypothetical protein n=1 Tax=Phaeodactylibacter sp. TaxID=1940289 RepID=UPI0032EE11CB
MNNLLISDTLDEKLGDFFKSCSELAILHFGDNLTSLIDDRVNSITVSVVLESADSDYNLVIIYCHGDESSFLGLNNEVILTIESPELIKLANSIIYSFSCSSGSILGPKLVNLGCRAFIGYNGEANILTSLKDEFAACVHTGVEQLLAGSSAEIAYKSVIHQYKKLMMQVDFFARSIINDNIDKLVLIGDPSSEINE